MHNNRTPFSLSTGRHWRVWRQLSTSFLFSCKNKVYTIFLSPHSNCIPKLIKEISIIIWMKYISNYRPQWSCGQGNIFAPVCHSIHGGGGIPEGTEADPPGSRPPWSRPPWEQTPPPPQDQTPPRADYPPPTPPRTRHTPPPREAESGIRSTSGRYASYWNAFLFLHIFKRTLLIKRNYFWCRQC